jgi:hypothetical protein
MHSNGWLYSVNLSLIWSQLTQMILLPRGQTLTRTRNQKPVCATRPDQTTSLTQVTDDTAKKLRDEIKADDARRDAQAAKAGQPPPDIMSIHSFIAVGINLRHQQ